MALENLFIRTKRKIGTIELDGVLSEGHQLTSKVSSNPNEKGFDISDNVINEPIVFNIVGVISDTPLGTAALNNLSENITGLFKSSESDDLTRSQRGYEEIFKLWREKEPIEVQTKLYLYENMVITSVVTNQDKDTSRVAEMQITLQEVIIVDTKVEEITVNPKEEVITSKVSTPETPGKKLASKIEGEANKTIVKTIKDFITGFIQ